MFTGIIEALGTVRNISNEDSNVKLTVESKLASELKIDQSLAHNGVCLTVTSVDPNNLSYTTVAIKETLDKTNLNHLKIGKTINLERCMVMNGRLDGHIVQGHVDQTGVVKAIQNEAGSWKFTISYDPSFGNITVEKGSICVNGVSLTVVDSTMDSFSVAIIPYTYEHTTFRNLAEGDQVNLEFDILGKYIAKYAALYMK